MPGIERTSLTSDQREAFSRICREKIAPLCPSEMAFRRMLASLLKNRDNREDCVGRQMALNVIWRLASTASRFGVDDEKFYVTSPFCLPAIRSRRLIELEIITNKETIAQIDSRDRARSERSRPPAENRIEVLAESDASILLTEYFTVTLPKTTFESDRIRHYRLIKEGDNLQLYFLEEEEIPHMHAAVMVGEQILWFRLDANFRDFRLPEGVSIPKPECVDQPAVAANGCIATLLALTVGGVSSSK